MKRDLLIPLPIGWPYARTITGLLTTSVWGGDDYRIVFPWERFKEKAAVESRGMMQFKGGRIELPREERFMPSLEGLRWHRERSGIG